MKMLFLHDLDIRVLHTVNEMQNRHDCIITLLEDKNGAVFMDVYIFPDGNFRKILVCDNGNKRSICYGIRRWFKANGENIKKVS